MLEVKKKQSKNLSYLTIVCLLAISSFSYYFNSNNFYFVLNYLIKVILRNVI